MRPIDARATGCSGTARSHYFRRLPHGLAVLEMGGDEYVRALVADSVAIGGADLLYALEGYHNDGPWENPDDYERVNGTVRATLGDESAGSTITLQGYDGEWTGTDQIPRRAVDQGLVDRGERLRPAARVRLSLLAGPLLELHLRLRRPRERRPVRAGGRPHGARSRRQPHETTLGIQFQRDDIENGLFRTREREVLSTTREDDILESSVALHAENRTRWSEWFRTVAGLRGDVYDFEVESDNPANSGNETDAIASPKLSLVFGPWSDTELYVSGGLGFHSNDARGVTTTDDPTTPEPGDGDPVDPLVRTKGAEIGVRTAVVPRLQSTLSLFLLDIDSDALHRRRREHRGEPPQPAHRRGGTNFYEPLAGLTLDLDASLSHARFRDDAPEGDEIPGAIESAVAAGIAYEHESGWFAGLRLRHFGPRPLIEDGSVESSSSTLVNARAGFRIGKHLILRLDVLNLFDRDVEDVEYYYVSRLPGEDPGPDDGGYADLHFHPAEPFTLRLGLIGSF